MDDLAGKPLYHLEVVSCEGWGCGVTVPGDPLAAKDGDRGKKDDFYIEEEGDMVDVPQVVGEFFFPRDGITAVDLCPTGEAGAKVVAGHLFGAVEGQVFHQQRPWADKAHLSFENVEQFGQLVEAAAA